MQETKKKSFWTPYNIFTFVSLLGILTFFIIAVIKGKSMFDWIIMQNYGGKYFLDYFRHITATANPQNTYTYLTENFGSSWGCFPPLAYVFYWLIYRMTIYPGEMPENYIQLMNADYSLMVFLLYSVITVLLLLYAFTLYKKQPHIKRAFFCILCSVPVFAGALERGNMVFLVFSLLLIAINWMDSTSKIKRESALILIAICAGLKIYPAIMGLLYIKEKRWKEALRLMFYGIIFCFLPFLIFGGYKAFSIWLVNLNNTANAISFERLEYIGGLALQISSFLPISTSIKMGYIPVLLPLFFLLFMSYLFFTSKNKYRSIFYLCAIMTFYPSNAFRYTLVYLAIPLVMFLMERGNEKQNNVFITLEMICYGCVFSIPTFFGILTNFKINMDKKSQLTDVELWVYLFSYILLMLIVVHESTLLHKGKKQIPIKK